MSNPTENTATAEHARLLAKAEAHLASVLRALRENEEAGVRDKYLSEIRDEADLAWAVVDFLKSNAPAL